MTSISTSTASPRLEIRLPEERTVFVPGEAVDVECRWWLPEPKGAVELRLVWHTSGTGNQDLEVVQLHPLGEAQEGTRTLHLQLPERPHSFSGQLITLTWSLELVIGDGEASIRRDVVVAPRRREITLAAIPTDEPGREGAGQ